MLAVKDQMEFGLCCCCYNDTDLDFRHRLFVFLFVTFAELVKSLTYFPNECYAHLVDSDCFL
jgi:hypothetical protein